MVKKNRAQSVMKYSRTNTTTPSVDSEVKRVHTVDMLKDRTMTNSKNNSHKSVHWDNSFLEKSQQSETSKSSKTQNERTLTHTVTPTVLKISNEVDDVNAKLA